MQPPVRRSYPKTHRSSSPQQLAPDLQMIGHYDQLLKQLESNLVRQAKQHDPQACFLLQTIPGVGKLLSLVLLYEIHTIDRFPSVGDLLSYARLVTPKQTSDSKISNAHFRARLFGCHAEVHLLE